MILTCPRSWRGGGRKPRASGDDPLVMDELWRILRVNPARAGMIPYFGSLSTQTSCKPRASGDDPPGRTVVVPVVV